jgi:membrane-associated phospholipid phosphatase
VSLVTKTKYLILFIFLNLVTYFGIQFFITVNEYDLLTQFDLNIPFIPEFVWIYHTLVPVIVLTMLVLVQKKELFLSAMGAFAIATLALSIFYIAFPSFYPRESFHVSAGASGFLLEMTRLIDGAHNTFPSSHVTFAWLLTFLISLTNCVKKNKLIYLAFFAWATLISISTVVLKQHYVIDVFSGMALAAICYFLSKTIIFERLQNSS